MPKRQFYLQCNSEAGNGPPEDFTINFNPPLDLTDGDYVLALDSLFHYYSWYNISAQLGNNLISYNNGATDRDLVIPDGQYTIELLNAFIHAQMVGNGDFTVVSGENVFDINILPNYAELKVDIIISGGYTLDLTQSPINELLGWTSVVVNASGTGANPANINNGVNSLSLACNIVSGGYAGGASSNIIASWQPNNGPGSSLFHVPINRTWNKISRRNISEIGFRVVDQRGRPIVLNGEPFVANIVIAREDEVIRS